MLLLKFGLDQSMMMIRLQLWGLCWCRFLLEKLSIYETSGLSKETHRAIRKYASAGSVKIQLTHLPGIDFSDVSQIQMLIHSKEYFTASAESWLSALDFALNQDAIICALGGLIGHFTRLMLHDALKNGEVLPYHVYKTCQGWMVKLS